MIDAAKTPRSPPSSGMGMDWAALATLSFDPTFDAMYITNDQWDWTEPQYRSGYQS